MNDWLKIDPRSVCVARPLFVWVTLCLIWDLSPYIDWSQTSLLPSQFDPWISTFWGWLKSLYHSVMTQDTLDLLNTYQDQTAQTDQTISLSVYIAGVASLCFSLGLYTRLAQAICLCYGVSILQTHSWLLSGVDQCVLWWWLLGMSVPWGARGSIDSLKTSLSTRPEEGEDDLNHPYPLHRTPLLNISTGALWLLSILTVANMISSQVNPDMSSNTLFLWINFLFIVLLFVPHWTARLVLISGLGINLCLSPQDPSAQLAWWVGAPLLCPPTFWNLISKALQKQVGSKIYIFYDGECGFSHQCARILSRLDLYQTGLWLGYTDLPFSPPDLSLTQIKRLRSESILVYDPQDQCSYVGMTAIARLVRIIPLVGAPCAYTLRWIAPLIQPIYHLYAKVRRRLPGRSSFYLPLSNEGDQRSTGQVMRTQLVKVLSINHLGIRGGDEASYSLGERSWRAIGDILTITLCLATILSLGPLQIQDHPQKYSPRHPPTYQSHAQHQLSTLLHLPIQPPVHLERPTLFFQERQRLTFKPYRSPSRRSDDRTHQPQARRDTTEFIMKITLAHPSSRLFEAQQQTRWNSTQPPPPFNRAPDLFLRVIRRAVIYPHKYWRGPALLSSALGAESLRITGPSGSPLYFQWRAR